MNKCWRDYVKVRNDIARRYSWADSKPRIMRNWSSWYSGPYTYAIVWEDGPEDWAIEYAGNTPDNDTFYPEPVNSYSLVLVNK